MVLRFRTLIFFLFLIILSGFLAIFSLNFFSAAESILREEAKTSMQQSAAAIQRELEAQLRLLDQELAALAMTDVMREAVTTGSALQLQRSIEGSGLHGAEIKSHHFLVVSSFNYERCYVLKSRLLEIGSGSCEQIYHAYSQALTEGWSSFRSGAHVLLGKDYLITDTDNRVVGRVIGGIKLSDNRLFLSQLVNRSAAQIHGAQLLFDGVAISQYDPNQAVATNQLTSHMLSLPNLGSSLGLQLDVNADQIGVLGKQMLRLIAGGVLVGLLVSAFIALILSGALDKQLQKLLRHVRDTVDSSSKGEWNAGTIAEFNHLGKEIDTMVQALTSHRSELHVANERLEQALREKRAILHQLIHSQEQERNHLAHELHDELGQLLTAVRVETVLLEYDVDAKDKALEHIDKIKHLVADMYETVYDRIMALRPAELDDMGLSESIRQIAALKSLQQTGVEVFLDIEDVVLPGDADIHLYRIIQEALTNVLKHAHASCTNVVLKQEETYVLLRICDDGAGFDESKGIEQFGGFGLLGIKERCEYMGAELKISGDHGVCIEVSLAIRHEECLEP